MHLVDQLKLMEELAKIYWSAECNGAPSTLTSPNQGGAGRRGRPVDIVHRPRTMAERIIEEFMLVANETVAEHFAHLDSPFIYRIHEKPATEKILELNRFIHNFGHRIKGKKDDVHPKALQQMLNEAQGQPYYRLLSTVTLRSMRQAKYSERNVGHFGLAAQYYTHFTAPIRRYPDLLVHRFITYWLGEKEPKAWQAQVKKLKDLAEHCSRRRGSRRGRPGIGGPQKSGVWQTAWAKPSPASSAG